MDEYMDVRVRDLFGLWRITYRGIALAEILNVG